MGPKLDNMKAANKGFAKNNPNQKKSRLAGLGLEDQEVYAEGVVIENIKSTLHDTYKKCVDVDEMADNYDYIDENAHQMEDTYVKMLRLRGFRGEIDFNEVKKHQQVKHEKLDYLLKKYAEEQRLLFDETEAIMTDRYLELFEKDKYGNYVNKLDDVDYENREKPRITFFRKLWILHLHEQHKIQKTLFYLLLFFICKFFTAEYW